MKKSALALLTMGIILTPLQATAKPSGGAVIETTSGVFVEVD